MTAAIIYCFCSLTSFTCAWLLLRAYATTRFRLLLWSGLCFVGLTVNNALLVVDRVLLPETDLSTLRLVTALAAVALLLFGLVWETD